SCSMALPPEIPGTDGNSVVPASLLALLQLVELLQHSRAPEQAANRIRRLGAVLQPFEGFLLVDLQLRRLGERVVIPDFLDEPAVARRTGVGHHHAVERLLVGAHSFQTNADHCFLTSLQSRTGRAWAKGCSPERKLSGMARAEHAPQRLHPFGAFA